MGMIAGRAREILKPGERLPNRVARGVVWIVALRMINNILGFARLIILARILLPGDFGLMGMALLTLAILESGSRLGLETALIQKKENVETYLNAAWTAGVIRGLALFAVLSGLAPMAAKLFRTPDVRMIIQAAGAVFLFHALTNIGLVLLQRDLDYPRQFVFGLSGELAGLVTAVAAAVILRNAWALVIGYLAGSLTRCLISYLVHPFRPRLRFEADKVRELFRFGRWILGSAVAMFLITQGDDVFVGAFLGPAALGFYQMAYRISNVPATEITNVISEVTFPAYSRIQDAPERLQDAYLKVLQITVFFSFPAALLILCLARDMTLAFLGEKWLPMVPVLKILTVLGLIRSVLATTGPLFYAVGRPKLIARFQILQLLLLAVLIYPLSARWGLPGTGLAAVVSALIPTAAVSRLAVRQIRVPTFRWLRLLLFPLLAAAGSFGLAAGFRILVLESAAPMVRFLITLIVFLAGYAALSRFMDQRAGVGSLALLKEGWRNLWKAPSA